MMVGLTPILLIDIIDYILRTGEMFQINSCLIQVKKAFPVMTIKKLRASTEA